MASRVSFTPQARDDLIAIKAWIAEHDESAADRIASRIQQTAAMFGQFPMLGRKGKVEGTREFSVTGLPYLIVYAIASKMEVDIVTIIHTRRMYPSDD